MTEAKQTWYPEVPIEDWLRRYRNLPVTIPQPCKCGAMLTGLRPVVSGGFVGVETDKCEACGRGGLMTYMPVTEEAIDDWDKKFGWLVSSDRKRAKPAKKDRLHAVLVPLPGGRA